MAKYRYSYVRTHDIDWFCKIGNRYCHFASNGGLIPAFANDSKRNKEIQNYVGSKLSVNISQEDIVINHEYVNRRLKRYDYEWDKSLNIDIEKEYLRSFVEMAQKGFWSYDCDILTNIEEEPCDQIKYALIARHRKSVPAFKKDGLFPRFHQNNIQDFKYLSFEISLKIKNQ